MIGGVALVEKVDDDHIELLAVAVASADALLDALRIPRQVVVDDQIAELQIDPFGGGFGGDHDGRFVAEILDEGGAHIGGRRTRDLVRAGVAFEPTPDKSLSIRIGVGAVEKHDLARKFGLSPGSEQIFLGSPGFGEDQGLLLKRRMPLLLLGLLGGGETASQGGEQYLALRVLDDGLCERVKLAQHRHLLLEFR